MKTTEGFLPGFEIPEPISFDELLLGVETDIILQYDQAGGPCKEKDEVVLAFIPARVVRTSVGSYGKVKFACNGNLHILPVDLIYGVDKRDCKKWSIVMWPETKITRNYLAQSFPKECLNLPEKYSTFLWKKVRRRNARLRARKAATQPKEATLL